MKTTTKKIQNENDNNADNSSWRWHCGVCMPETRMPVFRFWPYDDDNDDDDSQE